MAADRAVGIRVQSPPESLTGNPPGCIILGNLAVLLSSPEKALLDQLNLIARGRASLALDELDCSRLSPVRVRAHAAPFPPSVQADAQRLIHRR